VASLPEVYFYYRISRWKVYGILKWEEVVHSQRYTILGKTLFSSSSNLSVIVE